MDISGLPGLGLSGSEGFAIHASQLSRMASLVSIPGGGMVEILPQTG
jgi:hypothetical protein